MTFRNHVILSFALLAASSCRREDKINKPSLEVAQTLAAEFEAFGPAPADYSPLSNTVVLKRDMGGGQYNLEVVTLPSQTKVTVPGLDDPFLIRLSPDGQRLFFVSNTANGPTVWRPSIKVLPDGEVFQLRAPDIRQVNVLPSWNADSTMLAYAAITGSEKDPNNHIRLVYRDPSRDSQALQAKGIIRKLTWLSQTVLGIVEENSSALQRIRALDVDSRSDLWTTDWSFSKVSSVTRHPTEGALLVTAQLAGDPAHSVLRCSLGACQPISDGTTHEVRNAVISSGTLFIEEVINGRTFVRRSDPSRSPPFASKTDEASHAELFGVGAHDQSFVVHVTHPDGSWSLERYRPDSGKYEVCYQSSPQHLNPTPRRMTISSDGIDVPIEFWETPAVSKAGLFVHVNASPGLWLKSTSDPWMVSALTKRGFDVAFVNVSGSGGFGDKLASPAPVDIQASQLYNFLASVKGKYARTIVLGMSAGTAVVTRSITGNLLPNVDAALVSVVENCMGSREPVKNNGRVTIFVPEQEHNGRAKAALVADEIFRSSFQGGVDIVDLKGEGHVVRHRDSWTTVFASLLR